MSHKPFLKWPGGKRWLVPIVREIAETVEYRRLIEPFLGGGAIFFGLAPESAILSDVNSDLMNVYEQVKVNPDILVKRLKTLPVDQETYYAQRANEPSDTVSRAVRFLYLNRTAFAGMYRLNRQGKFNVPYGGGHRTTAALTETDILSTSSGLLQRAEMRTCDFEETLNLAGVGDLVYCDPAYTVAHNNNGFVRYNERNFSWSDQSRLARAAARAAARGAFVIVSNAEHEDLRALYPNSEARTVTRWCGVCPAKDKRQDITEQLFILTRSEE